MATESLLVDTPAGEWGIQLPFHLEVHPDQRDFCLTIRSPEWFPPREYERDGGSGIDFWNRLREVKSEAMKHLDFADIPTGAHVGTLAVYEATDALQDGPGMMYTLDPRYVYEGDIKGAWNCSVSGDEIREDVRRLTTDLGHEPSPEEYEEDGSYRLALLLTWARTWEDVLAQSG